MPGLCLFFLVFILALSFSGLAQLTALAQPRVGPPSIRVFPGRDLMVLRPMGLALFQPFEWQGSSDLVHWETVATNIFHYVPADDFVVWYSNRFNFYRLLTLPQ